MFWQLILWFNGWHLFGICWESCKIWARRTCFSTFEHMRFKITGTAVQSRYSLWCFVDFPEKKKFWKFWQLVIEACDQQQILINWTQFLVFPIHWVPGILYRCTLLRLKRRKLNLHLSSLASMEKIESFYNP